MFVTEQMASRAWRDNSTGCSGPSPWRAPPPWWTPDVSRPGSGDPAPGLFFSTDCTGRSDWSCWTIARATKSRWALCYPAHIRPAWMRGQWQS